MSHSAAESNEAAAARPFRKLIHFIAAGEPNSVAAQENLQRIFDAEPHWKFELRTIDVMENYQTALEHRVLVTPCLVLLEPLPRVMVVGTLKDTEKVRAALRLNQG